MRLIDADVLCETLTKREEFYHNGKDYNTASAIHMVKEIYVRNAPTVDTERHGHWIFDRLWSTSGGTYGVRRCSNCEYYCNDFGDEWNYCPHCGALMDEVEE